MDQSRVSVDQGRARDGESQSGATGTVTAVRDSRLVSASRGVFWSTLNTLAPLLIGTSVFVVTSRILSPHDFGLVALASTVALLASCLVPAGFGDAIVQRPQTEAIHFDSVLWLCMACGLLIYLAISAGAWFAAERFSEPALTYLVPILSLRIIFDAAAIVPLAVVRRTLSFRSLAVRTTISSSVAGTMSLALALSGYGYWALVGSQLAGSLVGAIGAFWAAKWRPGFRFSYAAYRELRRFGHYASATRIVNILNQQCDQLIVGLAIGVHSLGLYAFSRRATGILSDVITGTLTTVAMPLMSAVHDDRAALARGFFLAVFLSSLVGFPVFGGLAVIAPNAVPLIFGEHWVNAVSIIQMLCLLGFLLTVGMLQAALINSVGNVRWWFGYQISFVVVNIAVIFIFAPFGIHAMMLAIIVRAYLFFPIPCLKTAKILNTSLGEYVRQFFGPAISTAGMTAAVVARQTWLPVGGRLESVAVDVALGALVYSVAILLTNRTQVGFALSILRRAVRRSRPSAHADG